MRAEQGRPAERSAFGPTRLAWSISLLAIAAVFLSWLLLWLSARQVDSLALARQRLMISWSLARSIDQVAYEQESSTSWTEAARQISRPRRNLQWIDDNLGIWFFTYYGHDEVFILDPAGRPVYAMRGGRRASPALFRGDVLAAVEPLARELRRKRRLPGAGNNALLAPRSADFALIEGRPAIVSLKPIVPERGSKDRQLDAGFIHVSIVFLEQRFVRSLVRDLQVAAPRFSRLPADPGLWVPVRSGDGLLLGYFTWTPFRPGALIARRIAPVAVGALLIVAAVITFLVLYLQQRTSRLQASEAQAQYLASHDLLTGLFNRSFFHDRVRRELARTESGDGYLAYLRLDMNGFREINDRYGQPAGDDLIRTIAGELAGCLGADHMLARTGGDEFSILQIGLRGPAEVEALCQRAVMACCRPFRIGDATIAVGLSIGIAVAWAGTIQVEELARRADVALAEAKAAGGGWSFFSPGMEESRHALREMAADLREALFDGDPIVIRYQPVFAAKGSRIIGAEAFVHWHDPARGRVAPASFMPVVEEIGLVDQLTRLVLGEICRAAKGWPALTISVNISPAQLRRAGFAEEVLTLLDDAGVPPERLVLEISETNLIASAEDSRANLARLREAGMALCVDDFGVEYHSFSHLTDIPAQRIKIGRSLVTACVPGGEALAIARWIAQMGRTAGLRLEAEGVENDQQRRYLASFGYGALQGPLLAEPMSAEELTIRLGNLRQGSVAEEAGEARS